MKKYYKPVIAVIEMDVQNLIAISLKGDTEEATSNTVLSNERRGEWGDLWENGGGAE